MRVTRNVGDPSTERLSWEERWKGPDRGLVATWEAGLRISKEDPFLADRARQGQLVILSWKGGVEKATKKGRKYGSLSYLAMWHGLRGEPLDIALDEEVTLVCSRTNMTVTYTPDRSKYVDP